jgi:Domain of unknown function DUF29
VDGPTGLRRRRVGLNQVQAQSLPAKDWAAIDVVNLAEEIESVGRKHAHAVESYLVLWCLHRRGAPCGPAVAYLRIVMQMETSVYIWKRVSMSRHLG